MKEVLFIIKVKNLYFINEDPQTGKGIFTKDINHAKRFESKELAEIVASAYGGYILMQVDDNKPQSKKDHFNAIIKKANAINNMLEKIREKCQQLDNEIADHGDLYDEADYDYELSLLRETLSDLSSFDLEDNIPEQHKVNY